MRTIETATVPALIELLTGRRNLNSPEVERDGDRILRVKGLGYSQLNELLLLLGQNRVTHPFFQFLVDGSATYKSGAAIKSVAALRTSVERFLLLAMLFHGNIRYAFDYLSTLDENALAVELGVLDPIPEADFHDRHEPLQSIRSIPGTETHYLGYLSARGLDDALNARPNDKSLLREKAKQKELIQKGVKNHQAYLASDHMDVYVATSMRERFDFFFVNGFCGKVFSDTRLRKLNLRYFDPTQAYCHDRIDKGLAEALMLKRAKCTIFLAQESDTFGKDSELASTLAQGKPVVAYVPGFDDKHTDEDFKNWMLKSVGELYPELSKAELALRQLQIFDPASAWKDSNIRTWLNDPKRVPMPQLQKRLREAIRTHYESRAKTLRDSHPLGIQVNLQTGVANGVLVARNAQQCADLVHGIVTNTLKFEVERKEINGFEYLLLREISTKSIYRVVTGDELLTRTFWNFYLDRLRV